MRLPIIESPPEIPDRARPRRRDHLQGAAIGVVLLALTAFTWPSTSNHPIAPLEHASLEDRLASLAPGPEAGYSFAAYGDQRALAGRDWDELIAAVDSAGSSDPRLLFVIDTGDIVQNGEHADQFFALSGILRRIRTLPYLVGVGNHEVNNNRPGPARSHTARYLAALDDSLGYGRLYYRKIVGPARFLFLDSSDWVYGIDGKGPRADSARVRANAQFDWLERELRDPRFGPESTTIVVLHHPLIQSSRKHRAQARDLWSLRHNGRALPDILADGGVDLVLSGHTHTYERFLISRDDGRGFHLVNLSGKPESPFFGFLADFLSGPRRAQEIRGGADNWLYTRGWRDLDGWTITQEEVMAEDESNQYAIIRVDPQGGLTLRVRYLDRPHEPDHEVRLTWGAGRSLPRLRQD